MNFKLYLASPSFDFGPKSTNLGFQIVRKYVKIYSALSGMHIFPKKIDFFKDEILFDKTGF